MLCHVVLSLLLLLLLTSHLLLLLRPDRRRHELRRSRNSWATVFWVRSDPLKTPHRPDGESDLRLDRHKSLSHQPFAYLLFRRRWDS